MKKIATEVWNDKLYIGGIGAIIVSLFFFCLPFFTNLPAGEGGLFIPNFAIAIGYLLVIAVNGRLRKGRNGLQPVILCLILALISAYSLNRSMNVFEDSVNWFSGLLVLCCINYVATAFFAAFPRWLQHVCMVMLGVSLMVFIYLAAYLVPLYAMSAAVFFALGISLHSFVPLLFCIYTVVLINRLSGGRNQYWFTVGGSMAAVATVLIVFMVQWSVLVKDINKIYRQATVKGNNGLPGWMAVAQQAAPGYMMERLLKTELVYAEAHADISGWFWRMPSRTFAEKKKHDPLVMVATFFGGRPSIPENDRISILESIYDARHQAQERLWSGDDLFTEYVNTAVKIWPQFGLAYTEKVVTVTNKMLRSNWGDDHEALYTFHLPEGSVVTALSLWIEGKEAKGILTTKQKADSAYKTIVGRKRRDPSVIHWQEGNTVTVRVFPVLTGQSRMFKIGITSPLLREGGKLVYGNIWFDGPDATQTVEDVSLELSQQPKDLIKPASFAVKGKQAYTYSGRYDPNWRMQLGEQPLSTDPFCFDGKIFQVRPYETQRVPVAMHSVFLDINKAWTKAEFEDVCRLTVGKDVYVYKERLVKLTPENRDELFEGLSQRQFSLFPLFLINDPEHALLITKCDALSPNISDLGDSDFAAALKTYLGNPVKIKLFNLSDQLSPYLKTLKEYRVFRYERGSTRYLADLVQKDVFAADIENDQQVVIDGADMAITQKEGAVPVVAPDHLMRLFSYNHIMHQMGSRLITDTTVDDSVVAEAAKAYVVSPVSSLVVLETQKDYERFNIKDADNSLKNASLASKGAVPEPHEWALIIIAVVMVFMIKYGPVLKKTRQ